MDEYIQELIENKKKQKEIIKKLLSNTDYAEWLIDFTNDKEMFYDNDWDYSNEKLTDDNQKNVNYLSLFFEGIYGYAKENNIESSLRALGEYYQIKVDDVGFEIGYITGQGTSFYCKRIPLQEINFIDFMDIINNQKEDGKEKQKVYHKKTD